MDLPYKKRLHNFCIQILQQKLDGLTHQMEDLKAGLLSEAKSTAGDKHETGRAMLQLEMEKLGQQHGNVLKSLHLLQRISTSRESGNVQTGSLLAINGQWYFISVGLGAITFEEESIFCIAPSAPLIQSLLNKKKGDSIDFRGTEMQIEQII